MESAARRHLPCRVAARAEDRRGGRGGAGCLGHGEEPLPGSSPRQPRRRPPVLTLSLPSAVGQMAAIVAGAVFGRLFLPAVVAAEIAPFAPANPNSPCGDGAWPVRCAAARPALAGACDVEPCARPVRRFLPLRRAGLRRRTCRVALVATGRRPAGLDRRRPLFSPAMRGAGRPRPALHFRRLSRGSDEGDAQRPDRRTVWPRRHLSALLPAADRRSCRSGTG